MLTVITNVRLYAPEPLGAGQVLVGGGKILYAGTDPVPVDQRLVSETVDLGDTALVPGFIDAHVHVTGGGGEDGFATQALPVPLSQFTRHGVTTVVGLLGTDDETRNTAGLLARTRGLREEGLSAWCWTGGYHLPAATLTGSVRSDITHIDCVLGVGELALSDHRSSQPTFDELARLASEVHVAGLLARKAGVLHLHLGDGERGLNLVQELLDRTELPPRMFHPTHVNRRKALFDEACQLSHTGMTVDATAYPHGKDDSGWSAADAWERFHGLGCDPARITVSSDGGGCLPVFDAQGEMQRMDFATSAGLPDTLSELLDRGHALEAVLPSMTANVATLLKLPDKGRIQGGADADLVSLDETGKPRDVMAMGRWMVRDGKPVRKGMFEE